MTEVVCLHRYHSFAALYRDLPLLRCGYTEADVHTARPEDMNAYYTPEQQKAYGVLGIEIKLVECQFEAKKQDCAAAQSCRFLKGMIRSCR